jgi:hypothetical protein
MMPERPGWRVVLRTAVAVLAAVLAFVLPAANASAERASAAGNRVGASHPGMIFTVGVSRTVSAGEGRGEAVPRAYPASGACVAAEDGGAFYPSESNPRIESEVPGSGGKLFQSTGTPASLPEDVLDEDNPSSAAKVLMFRGDDLGDAAQHLAYTTVPWHAPFVSNVGDIFSSAVLIAAVLAEAVGRIFN